MRWIDVTRDPNSAAALDYRRRDLERAHAAPIRDREAYLCSAASGKRVLDIGVADHDRTARVKGFSLHRRIAESASSSLGVDILEEAIEALSTEGFDVAVADVCASDFSDRTGFGYDVVIAGEVIEHLGNPEMMMWNCRQVLAPHGRLFLTTPNPHCLRLVSAYLRGKVVESVDHLVYWFPSGIAELADRTGFRLIRYRGVISDSAGRGPRRAISRLAASTVLVPEAACWTIAYELEPVGDSVQ